MSILTIDEQAYVPDICGDEKLRPCWLSFCSNRVICGDPQSGKSSLLFHGLNELARNSLYDVAKVRQLPEPIAQTPDPYKFSVRQKRITRLVDTWVDLDGEAFSAYLQPDNTKLENAETPDNEQSVRTKERAIKNSKLIQQANSLLLVISAYQIISIYEDSVNKTGLFTKYNRSVIKTLYADNKTGIWKSIRNFGFEWNVVITQCQNYIDDEESYDELVTAVRDVADLTSFGSATTKAIFTEAFPLDPDISGLTVAQLAQRKNGDLVSDLNDSLMCSPGVALALVLNKLDKPKEPLKFEIELKH